MSTTTTACMCTRKKFGCNAFQKEFFHFFGLFLPSSLLELPVRWRSFFTALERVTQPLDFRTIDIGHETFYAWLEWKRCRREDFFIASSSFSSSISHPFFFKSSLKNCIFFAALSLPGCCCCCCCWMHILSVKEFLKPTHSLFFSLEACWTTCHYLQCQNHSL